jgi:hypothetical protein
MVQRRVAARARPDDRVGAFARDGGAEVRARGPRGRGSERSSVPRIGRCGKCRVPKDRLDLSQATRSSRKGGERTVAPNRP